MDKKRATIQNAQKNETERIQGECNDRLLKAIRHVTFRSTSIALFICQFVQ